MSYGGVSIEWLILDKQLRLRDDNDEELVKQLERYLDNNVKLDLVLNEIKARPKLYKELLKERPELWV